MNTVKQYLGKVSFTCNGEHDINKSYDRLCIVYTLIDEDENAIKSYISRKAVPVGINISNKEYWQPINVSIGDVFTEEDRLKLDGIESGATKVITNDSEGDGINRPVIINENKGVVRMPTVLIRSAGAEEAWNLFEYLHLDFGTPFVVIGEGPHLGIFILEASSTHPGTMSSEDYIKLFNIEPQATKSRIYQGSNPINLHDLLFNGEHFHVETNANEQTHEITLDNRRLVITPNLSTHTVDNTGKRTIEYCFRKYGDVSKLWAKIVSPGSDTFHLVGVTHYEFMLTRLDETDEVYEVVVKMSFGDVETEYILITYTAVDLSDGFEAYDLSRASLGLS